MIPLPNQPRKHNKKMTDNKTEDKKDRKPRETKEKSAVRLAADAFDSIRVLKANRQAVMDAAGEKHDAKILAVVEGLSEEALVAFNKLS